MTQLHAYFSGIVQGVGFRYTVHRYATDRGVGGWVRNLPDGRVEMKAEAEKRTLQDLLSAIESHFSGSIAEKQIYWSDQLEQFIDFKIAF